MELGERLKLADPNVLAYVWIHRFPMYQWDAEIGRWDATHNPFSGVLPEDESLLVTNSGDPARPAPDDPAGRARALQYDLALNGWELGGGSIRIHRRDLLERSFLLQGHSLEAMREKFGAVLDAFEFGAPPHGGIALGIDRWAALLAEQTNIREVMAFPKTQSGSDLMLEAPSIPDEASATSSACGSWACRRSAPDRSPPSTGSHSGRGSRPCSAPSASPSRGSSTATPRSRRRPGRSSGRCSACRCSALVAYSERRRFGALPWPTIRLAAVAGVFFAGDLLFWHHAIEAVGAGLATVLGNLQVIVVGVVAWLLLGERPSRATLLALPVVLARRRPDLGRRRWQAVRRGSGPRRGPGALHGAVLRAATCS